MILGIDPGLTQSGICLFDPITGVVEAKGVLSHEQTRQFIKKQRHRIDLIGIERPLIYARMQPGTCLTLGTMLREVGRLEETAARYKVPVYLISRADVLKQIVGRRPSRGNKVSKRECQVAVSALLGLTKHITPQHASDAAAVALAAWQLTRPLEVEDECITPVAV